MEGEVEISWIHSLEGGDEGVEEVLRGWEMIVWEEVEVKYLAKDTLE